MTDIHIPDEAWEAGARAICEEEGYFADADLSDATAVDAKPELRWEQYLPHARAAFTAMVRAWPGMGMLGPHSSGHGRSQHTLILPLQEKTDAA